MTEGHVRLKEAQTAITADFLASTIAGTIAFSLFVCYALVQHRTGTPLKTDRPCRLIRLEKHCRRDVKALTKLFHLLSVQLPFFLQNQGHNTLATQVVCKVL